MTKTITKITKSEARKLNAKTKTKLASTRIGPRKALHPRGKVTRERIDAAARAMAALVAQHPGLNVADYREAQGLPTRDEAKPGELTAGKALRAAMRRGCCGQRC